MTQSAAAVGETTPQVHLGSKLFRKSPRQKRQCRQSRYQLEGCPIENTRRSPRIVATIPLEIHSNSESLEVTTAVINRHGALILSPVFWAEGTALTIHNKQTGLEVRGRVAWSGTKNPSGLHKLGVEFETPSPGFWAEQYDPRDEEATWS